MNAFDTFILLFLNQFARDWMIFDKIVKAVAVNNLFKGVAFAVMIWWAWFYNDSRDSGKRDRLIATLFGSILAIGLARFLASILPFRARPIHEEALNFVIPYGVNEATLDGWSSFPSDHAVLFFALATGLFFVSKRLGVFALLYTAVVICLPRIYVGLHWPTDIIAGMVIGMTIACVCNVYLVKLKYFRWVTNISYTHPMMFYPLLFLLTYEIAELFVSGRAALSAVYKLFQMMF